MYIYIFDIACISYEYLNLALLNVDIYISMLSKGNIQLNDLLNIKDFISRIICIVMNAFFLLCNQVTKNIHNLT